MPFWIVADRGDRSVEGLSPTLTATGRPTPAACVHVRHCGVDAVGGQIGDARDDIPCLIEVPSSVRVHVSTPCALPSAPRGRADGGFLDLPAERGHLERESFEFGGRGLLRVLPLGLELLELDDGLRLRQLKRRNCSSKSAFLKELPVRASCDRIDWSCRSLIVAWLSRSFRCRARSSSSAPAGSA